jgi:FKBP-type peptidyl-prolyl cis-trans isomerase
MSTTRSQRIGIWVIAVVMIIGTIGSFFVVVLANGNAKQDQDKQVALQQKITEYQQKMQEQADQLSGQYYGTFSQYKSQPAAFDAKSVTSLGQVDLKVGDGEEIKQGTAYSAYYIGWNPSGKVFDQSIDGDKLKSPIPGGNLIPGWNEGVIGMKVGGVRELSIPAEKAYGSAGSGADIPPNTPIKFVVMIIPKPADIPQPDLSGYQQ